MLVLFLRQCTCKREPVMYFFCWKVENLGGGGYFAYCVGKWANIVGEEFFALAKQKLPAKGRGGTWWQQNKKFT